MQCLAAPRTVDSYVIISTSTISLRVVSPQFPSGRVDSQSMLCPSTVQISCFVGFFYSLFATPRTLGAVLINSTLSAAPSAGIDSPSPMEPVCVNNTRHSTWGPTLELFDFGHCQQAVRSIHSRLEGNIYNSYDFYSVQVYPSGPKRAGHDGWPLATGALQGSSKAGLRRQRRGRKLSLTR